MNEKVWIIMKDCEVGWNEKAGLKSAKKNPKTDEERKVNGGNGTKKKGKQNTDRRTVMRGKWCFWWKWPGGGRCDNNVV